MHADRGMRYWLVGVIIGCGLLLVAVLVLLDPDGASRAPSAPVDARSVAEQRRRGPGLDAAVPDPGRVPGPRRHANHDQGMPALRPGDVAAGLQELEQRRRTSVVEREYQRWFDAGYGPHQVEVELLDDGRLISRVTSSDAGFDDEPIAPGVLTPWDVLHLDRDVMLAVGDVLEQVRERTGPCIRAFTAKGRMPTGWAFEYVWHVRSINGIVRARAEVHEEWWPALFDAVDRACYDAALETIEREEVFTDAGDFDHRVEFQDHRRMEDEP